MHTVVFIGISKTRNEKRRKMKMGVITSGSTKGPAFSNRALTMKTQVNWLAVVSQPS